MGCSRPGSSVLHHLPEFFFKFMPVEVVMWSNHLVLCCPFLLLPSICPTIRVFPESALHIRWSKYWSFSNSPSSEYSGLIFFRIDWFDLLAVQGPQECSLAAHQKHQGDSLGFFYIYKIFQQWIEVLFLLPFKFRWCFFFLSCVFLLLLEIII